jgi:tetratricopeptide (TPR) repeat protein
MVVGTSGSGKSSLVRAGVIPDLQDRLSFPEAREVRIAMFRPGDAPVRSLARSLAAAGVVPPGGAPEEGMTVPCLEATLRRSSQGLKEAIWQSNPARGTWVLVVVDQFEEIFRFAHGGASGNSEDSQAFVRLLLEAAQDEAVPVLVLATMRSDYLGECSRFVGLPEAINAGEYLIPRMTREQRKRAILGPLACVGTSASPSLVQRLLNDAGDNPDQLPILQHALARTWDSWVQSPGNSDELDIAHYDAVGGMKGGLSRHADEAFEELSESGGERRAAERMFRALTSLAETSREMRRPLSIEALVRITGHETETLVRVIEVFRRSDRAFLVPAVGTPLGEDSVIDISHESLIRLWGKLSHWTAAEATSAQLYRRLSDWSKLHQRGEAALWRNPNLQLAVNWHAENQPNRWWAALYDDNWDVAMSFLEASIRRRRRERRNRRLTAGAVVLGMLVAVAFVTKTMRDSSAREKETALEHKLRVETEKEANRLQQEDRRRKAFEDGQKEAQSHLAAATKSIDEKKYEAAGIEYQKAVTRFGELGLEREAAEASIVYGGALIRYKRWADARSSLEHALGLAGQLDASRLRGRVLEQEGLLEEALAATKSGKRAADQAKTADRKFVDAAAAFQLADSHEDRARVLERRARIAQDQGEGDLAFDLYAAAEATYKLGNDGLGAKRTEDSMATLRPPPWGYVQDLRTGAIAELPPRLTDVVLGRQGSFSLGITETLISREHVVIRDRGQEIADLRSRNGTTLNGLILPYGSPSRLRAGDTFVMGDIRPYRFLTSLKPAPPVPPAGAWALVVMCVSVRPKDACAPQARYLTEPRLRITLPLGNVGTDPSFEIKQSAASPSLFTVSTNDESWKVVSVERTDDYTGRFGALEPDDERLVLVGMFVPAESLEQGLKARRFPVINPGAGFHVVPLRPLPQALP